MYTGTDGSSSSSSVAEEKAALSYTTEYVLEIQFSTITISVRILPGRAVKVPLPKEM